MTQKLFSNDDIAVPLALEPDAHGQAALMLAESTLHTLIEAGVFTTEQAIATVSTALELKRELADAAGESRVRMEASLRLLRGISNSLAYDLG